MAEVRGTSDNDRAAVTGDNVVTQDRLVEIAIEQNKGIFEVGSGAGVRGSGVIGVEAKGVDRGVVAEGKTGFEIHV